MSDEGGAGGAGGVKGGGQKEEREGGKLGWGKMEVEWHYDGFDQV